MALEVVLTAVFSEVSSKDFAFVSTVIFSVGVAGEGCFPELNMAASKEGGAVDCGEEDIVEKTCYAVVDGL